MQFVLDNSVSMRWALNDGSVIDQRYAEGILQLLESDQAVSAVVPSLWWFEAGNTLVNAVRRGLLTTPDQDMFFSLIQDLNITTEPFTHQIVGEFIMPIASRYQLSVYDATYLALCIAHQLPLASLDRDLNRAATQAGVSLITA